MLGALSGLPVEWPPGRTEGPGCGHLQGPQGSSETPLWQLALRFNLEEGKGRADAGSVGLAAPSL